MESRNTYTTTYTSLACGLAALSFAFSLGACSKQAAPSALSTTGGRSGVLSVDSVIRSTTFGAHPARSAALMGVYVSRYLAQAVLFPVRSALDGIRAQQAMAAPDINASDPDFALLQTLSDALQLNIADLLNRSNDRQKALDAYLTAMTNVAKHANDRLLILSPAAKSMESDLQKIKRQQSDLKQAMAKDIANKDFTAASEKQDQLTTLEKAVADGQTRADQTKRIADALDYLLQLYGQRILAIQKNREPLILGTQVIDVPGVKDGDLNILKTGNTSSRATKNGVGGGLFDFSNALNGL